MGWELRGGKRVYYRKERFRETRLGVDDGSEMVRFEYDQVATGERSYNVKIQVRSLRPSRP